MSSPTPDVMSLVGRAAEIASPQERAAFLDRACAGDEALRGWIERFRPEIVLSGHIHNSPFYEAGSWIDRIGGTWVFNPGRQIGPAPTHIALDLAAMTAEWTSAEGRSVRDLRVA